MKHILIRLVGSAILLPIIYAVMLSLSKHCHAELIEARLRQAQADTVLNFGVWRLLSAVMLSLSKRCQSSRRGSWHTKHILIRSVEV